MPTPVVHVFRSRGIAALPGYSVFIEPWAGLKTSSGGAPTRTQSSAALGGGYYGTGVTTVNNYIETDIWLDVGTYKVALIYHKDTDAGIYDIQLDGVSKGTVDGYAAAATNNNYSEVTGIAVTKGLKVLKLNMGSKNASSSAYGMYLQSVAWIWTGA